MFKYHRKDMNIFSIIFLLLLIFYFLLMHDYVKNSAKNYTDSIKDEISMLIKSKEDDTSVLSKGFASNKKLVEVMKNRDYDRLYGKNFFSIPKAYFSYKNIRVHVVDENGIQRYFSWTHNDLGKNILEDRRDLQELYLNPHSISSISVGRFGLGIKGIVPIYDEKHKFLGIIETITFFNSISYKLMKHDILSAVIIDKKYTKQLKYPLSKIFINSYNIVNINIQPEIVNILKNNLNSSLLNLTNSKYIFKHNSVFSGYYLVNVPIYNNNEVVIGHYLAFAKDIHHLKQKEYILDIFIILMGFLFIWIFFVAFRTYSENRKLIRSLDLQVQKQTQKSMKLLYKDAKTGAYTKVKFDEEHKNYKDAKVVMLNIRNFSKINEFYGFENGDRILKICVHRIKRILNKNIYRLNADEFMFYSYYPKDEIKLLKRKFSENSIKIERANINIRISFSFAVAKASTKQLISKLSTTVKEAKKYPFSQFLYYREKDVNDNFVRFNTFLHEAIFENKENISIVPFFQAIRNNKNKKILKYEALARLKVNDEIFSPFYFIEVAKSSGFIHEITKIMIDKSCAYLATLDENIELSINITEDDLATKRLKDVLTSTLSKYNISPNRITLEVLEGITSKGTKNNIKQLAHLKELGYKLAIDDFGVEYSNFERLSEINVDFIKIDGKYIKTLTKDYKSLKITKAIADFAHSLDIRVIAEFVENEEIQKVVESLGIEYSQGYYFAKPVELIEF